MILKLGLFLLMYIFTCGQGYTLPTKKAGMKMLCMIMRWTFLLSTWRLEGGSTTYEAGGFQMKQLKDFTSSACRITSSHLIAI